MRKSFSYLLICLCILTASCSKSETEVTPVVSGEVSFNKAFTSKFNFAVESDSKATVEAPGILIQKEGEQRIASFQLSDLLKLSDNTVLVGLSLKKGGLPSLRVVAESGLFFMEVDPTAGKNLISIGCASHKQKTAYPIYVTVEKSGVRNEVALVVEAKGLPTGFLARVPGAWSDGSDASYDLITVPIQRSGVVDPIAAALADFERINAAESGVNFAEKLAAYTIKNGVENKYMVTVADLRNKVVKAPAGCFLPEAAQLRFIIDRKEGVQNYSSTSAKVELPNGVFGLKRIMSNGIALFLGGQSSSGSNLSQVACGIDYKNPILMYAMITNATQYACQHESGAASWLSTSSFPLRYIMGFKPSFK